MLGSFLFLSCASADSVSKGTLVLSGLYLFSCRAGVFVCTTSLATVVGVLFFVWVVGFEYVLL